MFTPNQKTNLKKILPFGIIWGLFGLLYALLEYSILGGTEVYPYTLNPYDFHSVLPIVTTSCLVMGLFFGTMEVLLLKRIFHKRPFHQKIIFKTIINLMFLLVLLLLLAAVIKSNSLKLSIIHPEIIDSVIAFTSRSAFWIVVIYGGVITVLSLFVNEVSNYLGVKVFNNFFTGKYHRPIVEERIFMFLDMKSSTTIAEKLGHVAYFQLLNKYYGDTTKAIIQTNGEVYQYAGDEIIVSWSIKNGLQENNCIRCFYLMKEAFQEKSKSYIDRFGLIPDFKAGYHFGNVTTGEIGDLKKEIFFTGDVMNTTARIQSNCNKFKSDLLISEDLLFELNATDFYNTEAIGECVLRGRKETIKLFSVSPN
ncbi:MAG: adenylate cyclase [Lentimonas sp.]|jgi:adenylate cyclase